MLFEYVVNVIILYSICLTECGVFQFCAQTQCICSVILVLTPVIDICSAYCCKSRNIEQRNQFVIDWRLLQTKRKLSIRHTSNVSVSFAQYHYYDLTWKDSKFFLGAENCILRWILNLSVSAGKLG